MNVVTIEYAERSKQHIEQNIIHPLAFFKSEMLLSLNVFSDSIKIATLSY